MLSDSVHTPLTRQLPRRGPGPVTEAELRDAWAAMAQIVRDHGDVYLPIFERLDRELRAAEVRETSLTRALRYGEAIAKENRP